MNPQTIAVLGLGLIAIGILLAAYFIVFVLRRPDETGGDPLVSLILSRSIALGPMFRTGGVIHKVSPAGAAAIAALMREYAREFGIPLSLAWSVADGESRSDQGAIDPNQFLAKPGETPQQTFEHTDFGIEQEDGSTAEGDPQFRGLTLAQMIAKLLDPAYGVRYICSTTAFNMAWAAKAFTADPSLKSKVPNADPNVLGAQAYNLGRNGALKLANTLGLNGNWNYGLGVVSRARDHASLDTAA